MSYVTLESGILHVEAEIGWNNTIPFLATLREMDTCSAFNEITVHVSSLGGSGLAATAIAQALQTCKKSIRTMYALRTNFITLQENYWRRLMNNVRWFGAPGNRTPLKK